MQDNFTQLIERAAEMLRGTERVACMTGAGVSAESGVPTFRGAGGLWEGRRAESLATPEAFAEDPEEVWRFYLWRRKLLRECQPNPGHLALAQLEKLVPEFALVTQNVDGLHHQAGSRTILALHGDLCVDRCTRCGHECRSTGEDCETIPHCGECGAMMRPGVVWYGESLPGDVLASAQQACCTCQVMLVVGTSSVVQPAASLAYWAREAGASVIEVNPEATPLTEAAELAVSGPSGEVLPAILSHLT